MGGLPALADVHLALLYITRFLQLAFILGRKSFVFGNGDGVGAISWCHDTV
jgi:hypothetical protein